MICKNCGTNNDNNSTVCSNCGMPLTNNEPINQNNVNSDSNINNNGIDT